MRVATEKITEKRINTNKSFSKVINSFVTNKGFIASNDITLVEKNVVTTDEETLASIFNKGCIDIVEISSRKQLRNIQKRHMVKANKKHSAIF